MTASTRSDILATRLSKTSSLRVSPPAKWAVLVEFEASLVIVESSARVVADDLTLTD